MAKYRRKKGTNAGLPAELRVYDGGFCKVVCQMLPADADVLLQSSFGSSGISHATLMFKGKSYEVKITEARIDTFDRTGNRVGSDAVIAFSSLEEVK